MNYIEILLLGYALSIDAAIVSFGYGLAFSKDRLKNSLLLAFFTAVFQFIMPYFGWAVAKVVYGYIYTAANAIAATIFFILGLKFILDAIKNKKDDKPKCLTYVCLFAVAIATSIDALCAGANICLLNGNIFKSSLLIGVITFLNSFFSFYMSNFFRKINSKVLEILSGLILILLALKIYI